VFDLDKLNWLNGHYIRELDGDEFARRLLAHAERAGVPVAEDVVKAAAPLVQERVSTLAQGLNMIRFLFVAEADFEVDEAAAAKQLGDSGQQVLAAGLPALEELEQWTTGAIEDTLRAALVEGLALKPRNAFGPIRVAITGSTVSPPLFESMEILGRDRSLGRLRAAQQ
jgi:glutamyl-tRNA synthetase